MLATYARDEANNFEVVVFGDDPEHHLQVQRALAFDEQDVSLGMDTYCLVAGSGATLYGGILDFSTQGRSVRLAFTAEAVESLGVPPEISFDIEGPNHAAVASALARMVD